VEHGHGRKKGGSGDFSGVQKDQKKGKKKKKKNLNQAFAPARSSINAPKANPQGHLLSSRKGRKGKGRTRGRGSRTHAEFEE